MVAFIFMPNYREKEGHGEFDQNGGAYSHQHPYSRAHAGNPADMNYRNGYANSEYGCYDQTAFRHLLQCIRCFHPGCRSYQHDGRHEDSESIRLIREKVERLKTVTIDIQEEVSSQSTLLDKSVSARTMPDT